MVTNSTDMLLNGVFVLGIVVLVVILLRHFLIKEKYEDELDISTCYISGCRKNPMTSDCEQDTVFKLNTRSDDFENEKKKLLGHMNELGCSINPKDYKTLNKSVQRNLNKIIKLKKCKKSKPIRYFCINKNITGPGYL